MTDVFVADRRLERMRELEQSFMKAMRESRFSGALRFARTAMELDPTCKLYAEFIPLLEQKLELEADDGEDEEEEDDTATNDDDEDDEDSDEEDEEEEEEEEEEEDGKEAVDQNSAGQAQALHLPAVPGMITDEAPRTLNKQQRADLRAALETGIKSLKEKEIIAKMTALDPLLGA